MLYGTIPADPTTGFDGELYLVGERLVPGSVVAVVVNGTPVKVLPAIFHSSEVLGIYVYLTVPASYEFIAVAPDGSQSTAAPVQVPAGSPAALVGYVAPDVQMLFPPSLDTQFSGTVWLLGQNFMPGCTATITQQGARPTVVPLLFLNERTVGWVIATSLMADVTLEITNPTLLASPPLTVAVGPATALAAAPPQAVGPSQVSSPFVGSLHVLGSGIELGAVGELRPAGGTVVTTTPLVRVSSAEALWTLVYPQPGSFEMRVVNPGGAASSWWPFDVR